METRTQKQSKAPAHQERIVRSVRTWRDGISLPIAGVTPIYAMPEQKVEVRYNMGMARPSETFDNVGSGSHLFTPFVGVWNEASLVVGLTGCKCIQLPDGQEPAVASILYGSCTRLEEAYRLMLYLSRKRTLERGMVERAYQAFQHSVDNPNWRDYLDADSAWARRLRPPCLDGAKQKLKSIRASARSDVFRRALSISV